MMCVAAPCVWLRIFFIETLAVLGPIGQRHIARAQESHNNKGKEENERRAEIFHQEQKPDAPDRKKNVFGKASCGLQVLQRRRADKDKCDFHNFRRLNR